MIAGNGALAAEMRRTASGHVRSTTFQRVIYRPEELKQRRNVGEFEQMADSVRSAGDANIAIQRLGVHADKHQLPNTGAIQENQPGKIKDQVLAGRQEFLRGIREFLGFALEAQASRAMDYRGVANVLGFSEKTAIGRISFVSCKNGHCRTSPHGWIVSKIALLFHYRRRFLEAL